MTTKAWEATVLSLFPDMFPGPLGLSLAGKALESGIWRLEVVDFRGYARDKHRSVDGTPAGGVRVWCCGPMCWRRRLMMFGRVIVSSGH
jgi:tRNA (guanine-N1)-methyltransferase